MGGVLEDRRGDELVPQEFEDLVAPHVASFDFFLNEGLQTLVDSIKPVTVSPDTFTRTKAHQRFLRSLIIVNNAALTKQMVKRLTDLPTVGCCSCSLR